MFRLQLPEAANRNVERIDIEPHDACLGKIATQRKHFLSGGTTHRKDPHSGSVSNLLTHELEKVLAHADRLTILDKGKIRDDGTPLEVLTRGVSAYGIRDPRHHYDRVEDCSWLN